MSNCTHHTHTHTHKASGLFGVSEKQQGILIGAAAATAVTVPVTVAITNRAMKARWLEKAKEQERKK